MAFQVDQFRGALTGDGARPNLFRVAFNTPINNTAFASKLSFMCNAAQLPGSTIGTVTQYYFGREVKMAGNRTYADWTITIINDEDFLTRNELQRWHEAINDPVNNVRAPGFATVDSGYGVDAVVSQYGKDGTPLSDYTFYGMWPTDIAPIELNWGSNDQLEEYTVTFAFQYWQQTYAAVPGSAPGQGINDT